MSTYTFAGVSRSSPDEPFKVRFSNNENRAKSLHDAGHCDIDIIDLGEPMTKLAALQFLISIDFDNGNKQVRSALELAEIKYRAELAPPKPPRRRAIPLSMITRITQEEWDKQNGYTPTTTAATQRVRPDQARLRALLEAATKGTEPIEVPVAVADAAKAEVEQKVEDAVAETANNSTATNVPQPTRPRSSLTMSAADIEAEFASFADEI